MKVNNIFRTCEISPPPVFPEVTGCVSPLKNIRKLEYTALYSAVSDFFVDSTSDYIPFKHLLLALQPAALPKN